MKEFIGLLIHKIGFKPKQTGNTYYKETAKKYLQRRQGSAKWEKEQGVVKEFLKYFADGSRVLDIPFGTGRFVDLYLDKKMSIYGLDISKDMVDVAREVLGEKFSHCSVIIADATKPLPYEDDYFDAVVSWKFIKFFRYDIAKKILIEIRRVLKDKLIINVAIRNPDAEIVDDPDNLKAIGGNIYEDDLMRLFNESGFNLLEKRLIVDGSKISNIDEENTSRIICAYLLEKSYTIGDTIN
ncbi:MAG: class I SAM-dependent methyltransferase [Ignavibacterium sp.]|nr:class I SAM-dependent methyltransferase [Ignavibacterium sp.]